jgi:N-acylneuraminate cytidylyltransferase
MGIKQMNITNSKICAIVLARGGSKGIPKKNIMDFCGRPLIGWTLEQLINTQGISSIWVSSDSDEILNISRDYCVNTIKRPPKLSHDYASSESGWLHAINIIEEKESIDLVLAPQVTSPLREPSDFERAFEHFHEQSCDSLFSCNIIEDFLIWGQDKGVMKSINYDYRNRLRRQDASKQFLENGSFYIFKPSIIKKFKNRLGGKIGVSPMEFWKMFEIDTVKDVRICEAIMRHFLLKNK